MVWWSFGRGNRVPAPKGFGTAAAYFSAVFCMLAMKRRCCAAVNTPGLFRVSANMSDVRAVMSTARGALRGAGWGRAYWRSCMRVCMRACDCARSMQILYCMIACTCLLCVCGDRASPSPRVFVCVLCATGGGPVDMAGIDDPHVVAAVLVACLREVSACGWV
jgi:hypothetical protein